MPLHATGLLDAYAMARPCAACAAAALPFSPQANTGRTLFWCRYAALPSFNKGCQYVLLGTSLNGHSIHTFYDKPLCLHIYLIYFLNDTNISHAAAHTRILRDSWKECGNGTTVRQCGQDLSPL